MPERENIACVKRETDIFYALTYYKVKDFDIKKYRHLANTEDNFFSQKCLKKEQIIICSKDPISASDQELNKYWPQFFSTNYGS
jgi:hypothetical protein